MTATGLRSCCTRIDPVVRCANSSAIPAAMAMQAAESKTVFGRISRTTLGSLRRPRSILFQLS